MTRFARVRGSGAPKGGTATETARDRVIGRTWLEVRKLQW